MAQQRVHGLLILALLPLAMAFMSYQPLMQSLCNVRANEWPKLQPSTGSSLYAKKDKGSDVIEVDGIVKESLPNAKFRVELTATKALIVCSTSGRMRKNFVRVLIGDPVKVELSPYDLTRGRIIYRRRGPSKSEPS